jgi:hypothetical protein
MSKIARFFAWYARIEPKWFVAWAIGTAVCAATLGTTWAVPIMYLACAMLAHERNEAATIAMQWVDRAEAWAGLSARWMALYEAEKGKNHDSGQ